MHDTGLSSKNLMLSPLPAYFTNPKSLLENMEIKSYEEYLLELVNSSDFFRRKSDGQLYAAPEKEDHGQWDCISKDYSIDFKQLGSQGVFHAGSTLTDIIHTSAEIPGLRMVHANKKAETHKNLNGKEQPWINSLLRDFDSKDTENPEMASLIKLFSTKKNIMMFYTFNLFFGLHTTDFDEAVSSIIDILNPDFSKALAFRESIAPGYDTYFTFIYSWWNVESYFYDDFFVMTKFVDGKMHLIETHPISVSETFMRINNVHELDHGLQKIVLPVYKSYDDSLKPHIVRYIYKQGVIECLR